MVDLEHLLPGLQANVKKPGHYIAAPVPAIKPLLVIHSLPAVILMVSAILVGSLFMFSISALFGMKYAYLNQRGVGLYQDIFPGQAAAALDRFVCKPQQVVVNPSSVKTTSSVCVIFPQREPFHVIQVEMNRGKITESTFFSKDLQPEILFAYWGEPDATFRSSSHLSYQLEWHKSEYWASAIVNESNRAVQLITLRVVR